MKNILLPIDVYNTPEKTTQNALTFLHKLEGHFRIFLLKTYLVPASLSNQVIETHDELQNRSLKELQKELLAAQSISPSGKLSFESFLQMGRPINVIIRVVKEQNIDCVILGPLDGLKREENLNLLSRLHCPVIVLPLPV